MNDNITIRVQYGQNQISIVHIRYRAKILSARKINRTSGPATEELEDLNRIVREAAERNQVMAQGMKATEIKLAEIREPLPRREDFGVRVRSLIQHCEEVWRLLSDLEMPLW